MTTSGWFQTALLTFVCAFVVLGYLSVRVRKDCPPIAEKTLAADGSLLYSGEDVLDGQNVFQKYGLHEYGTLFGHGAYLGPDFTAQYLHEETALMQTFYERSGMAPAQARQRVKQEMKSNTYSRKRTCPYSEGRAFAYGKMLAYYRAYFGDPAKQSGPRRLQIKDPEETRTLTAFFAWCAWAASVARPGCEYSYTNNWPIEPAAGNEPPSQIYVWSIVSLIGLIVGTWTVLHLIKRYDLLYWSHANEPHEVDEIKFRPPLSVNLTPAQRATVWFFILIAGVFLLQGVLGLATAQYHLVPGGPRSFDMARYLPYNLSRTWHLQLGLFFVLLSFVAIGIFVVPMISARAPRFQDKLVLLLFLAFFTVLGGSLVGEALGVHGALRQDEWFWMGHQGWEYLDLGRMWQIALIFTLFFWAAILWRGMSRRLASEHPSGLPYLLLYGAIAMPVCYGMGLMFVQRDNIVAVEFWRSMVVHLWLEGFLNLFTTILIACTFVLLGLVRQGVATRVIYLTIVLYALSGVIGTAHNMFFNGAPVMYMALGAIFSSLETLPLLILTIETWRFIRRDGNFGGRHVLRSKSADFPHKSAAKFIIAVGFWNFIGAGVFGFLINLPIVSYYETGTALTASHAHAAVMGVYGMLALGFFMFVVRYYVPWDRSSMWAMRISFWSLNFGLLLSLCLNVIPLGVLQLITSYTKGYVFARQSEFYAQPNVQMVEWLRLPGDLLFVIGGILPVVYLALRMFLQRNRANSAAFAGKVDSFTEI